MNDESKNQVGDEGSEMGLADRDILERWLAYDSMTLRHAALIAHGASPEAEGLGLYDGNRQAVEDLHDYLSRLIELKLVKTVGDQDLYKTSAVFQALVRNDHKFPTLVREILLENELISLGTRIRPQRHANAERHENNRTKVLHAMIQVLADTTLHPTCRKGGAIDGPVIGADIARTILSSRQTLFEGGKLPLKSETIAKLFNEIVPPQVR